MSIMRNAARALIAGVILWRSGIAAGRAEAAPYSPAVRYPFGAPNYYGYFNRPRYLSPFRYSYYAAKHGWLYPRYYKPYHPYPIDPWHVAHVRMHGPWYGPNLGPWPYGRAMPLVVAAEHAILPPGGELPPAVRFAGCDYW